MTLGVSFLLLCFVSLVTSFPSSASTCGYDACPKTDPNKLNIHLVAHTHDDVGWLKTVDQYYYGIFNNVQRAGVQYIIDTVIENLKDHPDRRFIYVETSFFWKWWKRQDNQTREVVKNLVDTGRLEFISGGWSMNDEASVHYNSVIDSMSWGHRRLNDIFGKCAAPRIGWQIDPFGHSQEQASLLAQIGFDGLFFARLDYNDKTLREKENRMEFVWKASEDLGRSSDIFTGVQTNGYGYPPNGFCFDDLCADRPIIDDPESEEYNKDSRVEQFIHEMQEYAKKSNTNNVMALFGTDFTFQNAIVDFKNIDLLIKYVNERQASGNNMTVFYSTPSCYVKAIHEADKTWTTKTDDFFPYASDPHAFWTGYFTSRPAIKLQERKSNAFLQTCKQLQALSGLDDDESHKKVNFLKEAMGIAQHHDAVSGTEKQLVANDYALQLNKGVLKCESLIEDAVGRLISRDSTASKPKLSFCPALNMSECSVTEKENKISILVYNPRSQDVTRRFSLPWNQDSFALVQNGQPMTADLVQVPTTITKMPGRTAGTTHEIVFTTKIPALGFTTIFLERKPKQRSNKIRESREIHPSDGEFSAQGNGFEVLFARDGTIKGVKLQSGQTVQLDQNFYYYKGMAGDNKQFETRASGAYIFRPNGTEADPVSTGTLTSKITYGKLGIQVHQYIADAVTQIIRVDPTSKFIEFDWVVGPIPVEDKIGKEIIVRFQSDLKNGNTFYTDANGRQILKRIKNYRETFNYTDTEPVSGNYYPVNSRIFLRDEKKGLQLTVLTDRSQGGTSLQEGTLELMIHRRLLYDDAFGVGEALNEPGFNNTGLIVRGRHKILVESIQNSGSPQRQEAITEYLGPQLAFTTYENINDYLEKHDTSGSGLRKPLPGNVHLLTLEKWKDNTILIRLEHFFSKLDETVDTDFKKPVTLSLFEMFSSFVVESAQEMTLSGNQLLSEASRLKWKTADSLEPSSTLLAPSLNENDLTVTLNPMEIRTYLLTVRQ